MTALAAGFPLLALPGGACLAWTDQQVVYDERLISMTDRDLQINARREALVDWLVRHGIDPTTVPVPGWIVRDETNRCVVYWGTPDYRGACGSYWHCPGCYRVMVEQLEAPPLPFPMPWTPEPVPVSQYPRPTP